MPPSVPYSSGGWESILVGAGSPPAQNPESQQSTKIVIQKYSAKLYLLRIQLLQWKKLFSPYKIIDSENFIKVSQNPNKVARDTQGLPTVPHNDFGGLNFKGLASKYLLLMATSPYKVTFSKKNHEKNLLESEKTSDSALSGVVRIEIWSSFWFCVFSFWATRVRPGMWMSMLPVSSYICVVSLCRFSGKLDFVDFVDFST